MSSLLEYKGYLGSVEYSDEDEVFHGRIESVRDLVTYEVSDAEGIEQAVREAVDDYFALCKERNRKS